MPFYDYTAKKNVNLDSDKVKLEKNNNFQNERLINQESQKFVQPLPPTNQPFFQQAVNVQRIQKAVNNLNNVPVNSNPSIQYRFVSPPIQQQPLIVVPPPAKPKPDTRNVFVATDDVQTSNKSVQIEKDLIRMVAKSVNTDLKFDQVVSKSDKKTINFVNEGFRTYYDEQADVLGVMCFLCWANCCQDCNNICRGCRNTVSCPVYCWILFIIPLFLILLVGIIVAGLYGFSVNVIRKALLESS